MQRNLIAVSLFCLAAAAPAHAQQQDVASFYKGKQIHLLVGSAAGSGYDIGARVVARYLGKYIPGNPTVVVENQPGAASLTMTSALYNTQPRDGTFIGAAINGMPTAPLFEPTGTRFDPTKFNWLGSTDSEVQVTYVWHTAPVQSFADLMTKELITGATQPGTSQVDFPLIANAVLGTKFKVISGYLGTTDIHKAMEAGEVQGNGASAYASLKELNSDWLADKKVLVIAQWGFHKHPDLPDVPSVLDMAKNEADKEALRLVVARLQYSRPFFAPPDVPPARAAALRDAFEKTVKDPDFLADAAKAHMEVAPVSGQDVAALVAQVSASPPDVVARVRAALSVSTGK
jgi:tripartite-type tricarboxylate transporter receptor subunit TctC